MSDTLGFPVDFIVELHTTYETHMSDHAVVDRPLRPGDPAKSIGIFAVDTLIQQQNAQIGQLEPPLNTHRINMHNMIVASDEVTGRALFAVACKKIRVILYRDTDLGVRLRALSEDILGSREVVKRFGISRQRYITNEVRGVFTYVAVTELWIETEVVKL